MRKSKLGVPASPSGLRPFGVEPAAQSQAEPLVPNAAERILAILTTSLDPMRTQGMDWQQFYKWMKSKPDEIVSRLRESGVMFRMVEQANWPVVAEVFDRQPYGLSQTIRLQVKVVDQLFGAEQSQPYERYAGEPDYIRHVGKQLVSMVIREAAKPFEEEAFLRIAQALGGGREKEGGKT